MNNLEKIKARGKSIKYFAVQNLKTRTLRGIIPQIEKGTLYNIVTQKAINPYTFLIDTLDKVKAIDEVHIATYRISEQALLNLKYLIQDGKIKKFTLLINDNYRTLMRDKANLLPLLESELPNFKYSIKNSHAKITLIRAEDKHIVVQGSGNYSTNPKIEQYTIVDDKEVYNFHKEWIEE